MRQVFNLRLKMRNYKSLPTPVTQASSLTRHAGFQRALFDRQNAPLAGTGKMRVLHLWHPVETEPISTFDSHIHKLPDKFLAFACWLSLFILRRFTSENGWRRRKYDNFVCAGSPHQARAVCFAGAFAKHFQLASDQAFENPAIRFVYDLEQILIAVFFDVLVDLIRHFRGRGTTPR